MGTDGPFSTREQAQLRYGGYCNAASGPFGPGWRLNRDTLTDTLVTTGVELGGYDLQVLARVGALLGPLDCAVLNSLLQRAAGDTYDDTVHVVAAVRPRRCDRGPGQALRAPPAVTIVATVATG
jgi:hypothetical protein